VAIIQRMMPDAIRWYDQNVFDVSRRYESVATETVHGWLVDLLPNALALDVGAGTGRDAASGLASATSDMGNMASVESAGPASHSMAAENRKDVTPGGPLPLGTLLGYCPEPEAISY
jgi:ubiquinone/menaquinone biosynthesis C-methylase UbiE